MKPAPIYFKYCFTLEEEVREIALALLADLGFDRFEETKTGWDGYLPETITPDEMARRLEALSQDFIFSYQIEKIPRQNWNAVWEAGFKPIRVQDFCSVRADFHPPAQGVRYEIIINPKMAFGTGHHATTYLMMQAMETIPFAGNKVLDYGCGTGILAILARKMGAAQVQAVDIEWDAYENTLENIQNNQVNALQALHGTLANVADSDFGIILANINRNVILDSISALYEKLLPGGFLLVSGILLTDRAAVSKNATAAGFLEEKILERDEWTALLFSKA